MNTDACTSSIACELSCIAVESNCVDRPAVPSTEVDYLCIFFLTYARRMFCLSCSILNYLDLVSYLVMLDSVNFVFRSCSFSRLRRMSCVSPWYLLGKY